MTSSDEKRTQNLPWLHLSDYPDDNYDHILGIDDPHHSPSKLQQITALRIADTLRSKKPIDTQGCGIDRSFYASSEMLEDEIKEFDEEYGPPLNLADRISSTYPQMAIAAEFKRASPSKGDINPNLDVVQQCLQYDEVGAAVISVLTEFLHFKGEEVVFIFICILWWYLISLFSLSLCFSRNTSRHETSTACHTGCSHAFVQFRLLPSSHPTKRLYSRSLPSARGSFSWSRYLVVDCRHIGCQSTQRFDPI
jgi:hypothetical protein